MQILITAGPTREPIDAVRFLSNRSSGNMGLSIAYSAVQAGHQVTLLLGPVAIQPEPHPRLTVIPFESTAELQQLLAYHFPLCDLLIQAAAISDYRPRQVISGKQQRGASIHLELEGTPDLALYCAEMRKPTQRLLVFALEEPDKMMARAKHKLDKKKADAIVANPLSTMDANNVTATLIHADGRQDQPGTLSKSDFAHWLVSQFDSIQPRSSDS